MNQRYLKSIKVGAAVIASRRGGAVNAFDTINHFFFKSRNVCCWINLLEYRLRSHASRVKNDTEALDNMRNLGQNMAYLLKALKGKYDAKL